MQVKRLDLELFEQWRERIPTLIKETILANFSGCNIADEYYQKKCEQLKRYISENRAVVFIALIEGSLAGWIWCHEIHRFSARRLHIAFFAVFPAYKKQGIGKKLFHEAEAYAKECGMDGVDLCVTVSNLEAVGFYRHMGLQEERLLLVKEFEAEESP